MTLNPKSWHYRIADFYGRGGFWRRTDLCTYLLHFFLGVAVCIVAWVAGSMLGFALVMAPAFWIILCIADGHLYAPLGEALFGLSIWALSGGFVGCVLWNEYRQDHHKPFFPMPKAVGEVYWAWKDKYCPVIEIDA